MRITCSGMADRLDLKGAVDRVKFDQVQGRIHLDFNQFCRVIDVGIGALKIVPEVKIQRVIQNIKIMPG